MHPNLGSTLLVSRLIDKQKIGVGGSEGQPVGLEIFNRTFDKLVALFPETHSQLLQLKAFEFPE